MNLIVLSVAERELVEVVDYYNAQCPGLGYEFAAEVQRGFKRIQSIRPHGLFFLPAPAVI